MDILPVPTSQRPINGAVSGLAAQLAGNATTGVLMAHGIDPATAAVLGTAAGSATSATLATLGDWARGVLDSSDFPAWAKLPFMLMARIG